MDPISQYLRKQKGFKPLIKYKPSTELAMVITIPCHNEPDILTTLKSIHANTSFHGAVEVIILINQSEESIPEIDQQNEKSCRDIQDWVASHHSTQITYFPVQVAFPQKKAGVGSARKLAMDEAARRLSEVGNPNGIITGLDADSLVQPNYIQAIQNHFQLFPKSGAASIHYEHPILGSDFNEEIYDSIISYELHLRYFIYMQRQLKLPFAFQTIGSSMAVRAINYAQIGGMNRRQAGEDFYFLHKCIKRGGFSEVNSTTVIPSPRISDRVPFGTGKAIGDMISQHQEDYLTYHPYSFEALRSFVMNVVRLYWEDLKPDKEVLHPGLIAFLAEIGMDKKIMEVRQNASSVEAFRKRFFQVFDAFVLMKYLHFMRDHHYENLPVLSAVQMVLPDEKLKDSQEALLYFRKEHLNSKYAS